MSVDLQPLAEKHDLIFKIPLKVRLGRRFQPTGFPDLGAAVFETTEGTSLLVESAQSMANRLESVCWDESENDLIARLRGLSYVRVIDRNGAFLTSSVLEAHRLNSAYIEKATGLDLKTEIGLEKNRPLDRAKLTKALFRHDIGSLLHGVFLESIDGRLRLARALSAFIEADNVTVAASGGVKNDRVQPGKNNDAGKNASSGFGNLPFPRDEYTSPHITLFVSLDLAQIRGYRLTSDATKLLVLLALFKVREFVDSPMRLRTACMFERSNPDVSSDDGDFVLPQREDLALDIEGLIKGDAEKKPEERIFAGERGITTVTFTS
ncbi:MAG: type I-U CRISPR-associated protein Cas7 [Planctomycetes bacterium]|nr:type I-U CRISPR-associated protein Cas7 [Planctomycetota bacterium]